MNDYFTIDDSTVTISHLITAVPINDACEQINDFIKLCSVNPLTIVFNYKSEGFQKGIIHHMNDVVEKLVTEYGYDINMFLYHSGAWSIAANVKIYNDMPLDFLPKNILLDSTPLEGAFYTNKINREIVINTKPKKFLSMNGVPRTVRRLAVSWLLAQNLIKESFYSLNTAIHLSVYPESVELDKYNSVVVDITKQIKEPMILSKNFTTNDYQDRIKQEDVYYFDNSYFSLVQETFYDNTLDPSTGDLAFYENIFITEKTFRPIYFKHPFVMLGVKGSLSGLKEHGYKTFSPYFDESYDEIDDPVLRLETAMNEVTRLCSLSDDEWLTIQLALLPILEYNYKVLSSGNTKKLLGKRL